MYMLWCQDSGGEDWCNPPIRAIVDPSRGRKQHAHSSTRLRNVCDRCLVHTRGAQRKCTSATVNTEGKDAPCTIQRLDCTSRLSVAVGPKLGRSCCGGRERLGT